MSAASAPKSNRIQRDASGEKYALLVAHCAARINDGRWKVGDRLPTFVELQKAFGMTPGTVNRAMIALEQQGLIERRRGSGVYVAARDQTTRTGIIGIIGYGFNFIGCSAYWANLLAGIREGAAASGTQVLLFDQDSCEGWEKVDGMLVCDWGSGKQLRHVAPTLPCVSLLAPAEHFASVYADDYAGMRALTERLLQQGHRRIATIHHDNSYLFQRFQGYHDALEAAGIEPRLEWSYSLPKVWDAGDNYVAAGYRHVASWLKRDWKAQNCTALLCHNDETAIGAMRAFAEAGYRIPNDVSVVGFDGLEISEYAVPSLTTIKVPLHEMGRVAVEVLQKQIADDEVSTEHRVLPVQLQARASTDAAPRVAS